MTLPANCDGLPPPLRRGASRGSDAWFNRRYRTVALTFALVIISALVAEGVRRLNRAAAGSELPTLRLEITTAPTDDPTMALTPDGTQIAFVANQNRVPMLWVRALDAVESRVLPGTEGASFRSGRRMVAVSGSLPTGR